MLRLMAEYRIKDGSLEVVTSAISKFVAAVAEAEPESEYISYQIGETNRFIHLMVFVDEPARERHQKAAYTSQFVEVLYPNCTELPVFSPLKVIE